MCATLSQLGIDKDGNSIVPSVYVFEDETSIIMPYPSASTTGLLSLFSPFETKVMGTIRYFIVSIQYISNIFVHCLSQVWIIFLGSAIFVPAIVWFIHGTEKNRGSDFSLSHLTKYFFLYLEMILSRRNF